MGSPLTAGEKTVIRKGKRMPFKVKRRSNFDLTLGENALFEKIDGNTIPPSWIDAVGEIVSYRKPVTVMVMGGVDTGKTSFSTYLVNEALKGKWKVAVVDADLGQSDIGPPSTLGASRVIAPIKDLFDLDAESMYFVGLTSPSGAANKVLEGLATLQARVLETNVNFIAINTDGWIKGEEAEKYKIQLTEIAAPDVIVGIQEKDELEPILTKLKEDKVLRIETSSAILKRDQNKRKFLRELAYKKCLKGAKFLTIPMSWVKVKGISLGIDGYPMTNERIMKIENLLSVRTIYCEETPNDILVVLKKNHIVDEEQIKKVEFSFKKRVRINKEEKGLLVALRDAKENLLGIGVLCGVDYRRRTIKVYTPVDKTTSTISISQIRLDEKGKEYA